MRSAEVRVLRAEEVDHLIGMAGQEGWNPGLADAASFHATDPQGFLGAFVDGELAAGVSAVAYGRSFGFIGLYIAAPRYRGQGLGRMVWEAGMARLGERTIGVDGVPEQQPNYAKMGFAPAYETVRWSALSMGPTRDVPDSVTRATSADLPTIRGFDRKGFPAARSAFLRSWTASPRLAFIARHGRRMKGYGVVRRCLEGYKLGPLFAADLETATDLLQAALSVHPGENLHIDVPRQQTAFSERLEALGFLPGFTTARMYRGPAPALDLSPVYGITSLELG